MKKEMIICDKCGCEIPEDKGIVQSTSSSNYDLRTEDICMSCVRTNSNTTYAGGYPGVSRYELKGIDPEFKLVIDKEFWNIL